MPDNLARSAGTKSRDSPYSRVTRVSRAPDGRRDEQGLIGVGEGVLVGAVVFVGRGLAVEVGRGVMVAGDGLKGVLVSVGRNAVAVAVGDSPISDRDEVAAVIPPAAGAWQPINAPPTIEKNITWPNNFGPRDNRYDKVCSIARDSAETLVFKFTWYLP